MLEKIDLLNYLFFYPLENHIEFIENNPSKN